MAQGITDNIWQAEAYIDFGLDWNLDSGLYHLRITFLEHAEKYNYSVITEINIDANEAATARRKRYVVQLS